MAGHSSSHHPGFGVLLSPAMIKRLSSRIYGALDVLVAVLYLAVFTWVVPSRSTVFTSLVWILCLLMAVGGVGLFLGSAWGRRVATVASVVWLVACGLLILLLVSSAAYLHGIYDGIGQAGAAIALLAAALSIELIGLLPALQLAHLWRLRRMEQARPAVEQ